MLLLPYGSARCAGWLVGFFVLCCFVEKAYAQTDSWKRIGPSGGPVDALAVMPGGAVYAGTPVGLFRTDDQADAWRAIDTGFGESKVTLLAATTQGDLLALTEQEGLLRRNGTGAWATINTGLPDSAVVRALARGLQGEAYAGVVKGEASGVYRLAAGAQAWERVGLPGRAVVTLAVDANGILLAGEEDEALSGAFTLYRSTDGETWDAVVITDQEKATTPSVVFTSDGIAYAGGFLFDYDVIISVGIYRSLDGGQSWEKVPQVEDAFVVALFAGPAGELFVSDGVLTWRLEANGLQAVPFSMQALVFDTQGTLYAGGRRRGVRRSVDGGASWEEAATGLGAALVDDMVVDAAGTFFALGGRFYRSEDNGATWTYRDLPFPAPTFASTLLMTEAGHLFVQYAHTLHRSRDGGATWDDVSPNINIGIVVVVPSYMVYSDSVLYVAGANSERWFFRSDDDGDSWERITTVPEGIKRLAASPDGSLFATALGGGVYRSRDRGDTWQQVADLEGKSARAFGFGPTGTVLAGTSERMLYRSEDGGDTWMKVPFEHPDPEAAILAFVATADSVFYAGTESPDLVWRSSDDGLTWASVSSGFPATTSIVRDFALGPTGQVYAVASRAGLYQQVASPTDTALEEDVPRPGPIQLKTNYPNPFSRVTAIPFTLAQPAYVTLTIYDVLGRTVATLVDEPLPVGEHAVTWEAQGMPTGVYLARLRTDRFSTVRSLVLVR